MQQSNLAVLGCGPWVGIIKAHPWNLLGKFDLLVHPWKFDLFPRLDGLFVLRLKRLFQASKSFEVGIVF